MLAKDLDTQIFVRNVLRASCPSGNSVAGIAPHPLTGELVVVLLAQIFEEVSGTPINPALTLTLLCAHRLTLSRGVLGLGLEHSSHPGLGPLLPGTALGGCSPAGQPG